MNGEQKARRGLTKEQKCMCKVIADLKSIYPGLEWKPLTPQEQEHYDLLEAHAKSHGRRVSVEMVIERFEALDGEDFFVDDDGTAPHSCLDMRAAITRWKEHLQ